MAPRLRTACAATRLVCPLVSRRHLDSADNVPVELRQVARGDPVLQDGLPADLMDLIPVQECPPDAEPGDEAGAGVGDVPVASDPGGVLLAENGIKDRLAGAGAAAIPASPTPRPGLAPPVR